MLAGARPARSSRVPLHSWAASSACWLRLLLQLEAPGLVTHGTASQFTATICHPPTAVICAAEEIGCIIEREGMAPVLQARSKPMPAVRLTLPFCFTARAPACTCSRDSVFGLSAIVTLIE